MTEKLRNLLLVGLMALSFFLFGYGISGSVVWALPYGVILGSSVLLSRRVAQRREDESGFEMVSDQSRKAVRKFEFTGNADYLDESSVDVAFRRAHDFVDRLWPDRVVVVLYALTLVLMAAIFLKLAAPVSLVRQGAFGVSFALIATTVVIEFRARNVTREKRNSIVAQVVARRETLAKRTEELAT